MGFLISSELRPQQMGELKEGDVFVAHVPGDGRLIGMIGGDEARRLIIVLGSEGTAFDDQQVGWFLPDFAMADAVYKIEDARLEILRNARGYAEPIDQPENGSVTLDSNGTAWICTINDHSRVSFNLATGVAGSPSGRPHHYRDWQLSWIPAGAAEPIVLLRHEGTPR